MNRSRSSSSRRRLGFQVSLAALGVGVIVAVALASAASSGKKAPARYNVDPARWELPALTTGGRVRLADFNGRPVVVNFFASWCGPCQLELPIFARTAQALHGKVDFVAVNSQELAPDAGLALARTKGLEDAGITLARDVGGRAGSLLHDALGTGMPLNAFYDAQGHLLEVTRGALLEDKLADQLQRHYGIAIPG
jgi:cytochrome c biogenesis protein CcmG, thiol:disulfide interchange protein DsbE